MVGMDRGIDKGRCPNFRSFRDRRPFGERRPKSSRRRSIGRYGRWYCTSLCYYGYVICNSADDVETTLLPICDAYDFCRMTASAMHNAASN